MAVDIRTVMPMAILLTLRPVELWTLGSALAALALLMVVVIAIGWWTAAATARFERDEEAADHRP